MGLSPRTLVTTCLLLLLFLKGAKSEENKGYRGELSPPENLGGTADFLYGFPTLEAEKFCFLDELGERNCKPRIPLEFVLFTVASNETDGFKRFMRSVNFYKIPTKVLGLGEPWDGGAMKSGLGGGQKVNHFRKALKPYVDSPTTVVMFTDSYDVVLTEGSQEILEKFLALEARIVFSAEPYCWPDETLASSYPATVSTYKYLNSGGFMGYASDLYELLSKSPIKNKDDDQLFYTRLFLDPSLREKMRIKLDTKATIFQNLFGAEGDVRLISKEEDSHVENLVYGTRPSVIHGNGPWKLMVNSLGNYLAGAWVNSRGCTTCDPKPALLMKESGLPRVLLGVFILQKTPFINEFFDKINALDYPKTRISLFIYCNEEYHNDVVSNFLKKYGHEYMSQKVIRPSDEMSESAARTLALDHCLNKKCDYFFTVDGVAHLDSPKVLKHLIQDDRGVVGPLLVRPYKAWSNFWGSLSKDGFYARSFDYMDIVNREKKGIWNVPYIASCYLINATVIPQIKEAYKDQFLDPDMAFCKLLRYLDIFMYVDNQEELGHLVDPEGFQGGSVTNPEFYELINNQWDWEQRYIHPMYQDNFKPNSTPKQPCPDVFWFPIVTERFADELVQIMEAFGRWSSGSNHDERLTGGYENVPTRDIHMNQVGLEALWLQFLQLYVRPLQEMAFTGYYHDPPKSLMNFVVRYRPDEQPSLRPHHDSSTYTINIALNTPHVDYEGGGCRFIRYNCSVVDTKKGWVLMHPGRLTHFHEGLRVTNGTRYIMISFIDP